MTKPMIPGGTTAFMVREDAGRIIRTISPCSGTVAGLFEHSFNVQAGRQLFNFHTRYDAIHPAGILVPPDVLPRAHPGMTIRFDWPKISIGVIEGTTLIVPDPAQTRPTAGILRKNLDVLRGSLKSMRRCSMISDAYFENDANPLSKPARDIIRDIRAMRRTSKRPLLLSKYDKWFGAGEGTTPAWDDFCTGILLADRRFGRGRIAIRPAFLSSLEGRTTSTSYFQIVFASDGKSSILFERFLNELGSGHITHASVQRCIGVGHSSGSDILTGICAYLDALLDTTGENDICHPIRKRKNRTLMMEGRS